MNLSPYPGAWFVVPVVGGGGGGAGLGSGTRRRLRPRRPARRLTLPSRRHRHSAVDDGEGRSGADDRV